MMNECGNFLVFILIIIRIKNILQKKTKRFHRIGCMIPIFVLSNQWKNLYKYKQRSRIA